MELCRTSKISTWDESWHCLLAAGDNDASEVGVAIVPDRDGEATSRGMTNLRHGTIAPWGCSAEVSSEAVLWVAG